MSGKRVIYSESDIAGKNIAGFLVNRCGITPFSIPGSVLDMGHLPPGLERDLELLIVASRHKSESGKPTLTAHSPGNYGSAGAGGNDRELGFAPALYLSQALSSLKEHRVSGFETCFEATHHGPTGLPVPVIFVEVGSGVTEWNDPGAVEAAARVIEEIHLNEPETKPSAIGLGGGHYCRKFSKISDYAIGHICPKYNLSNLDESMLDQMVAKTVPTPRHAVVEKKGLSREKARIMDLLGERDLEIIQI